MRTLILIALITCCLCSASFGQKKSKKTNYKDYYENKNEFGINATNVLGNLLSLNPNNINSPYFVIYRRHFEKTSLRLGFNYDLDNSNQFDFTGTQSISKNVKASIIDTRIGLEWHYPVSKRFMFSTGADAVFTQSKDDSDVSTFNNGTGGNSQFRSLETIRGYGGGPFVRFDFKFNNLISLSTESTFYYMYTENSDTLFNGNGIELTRNTSNNNTARLALPQALFVNISF